VRNYFSNYFDLFYVLDIGFYATLYHSRIKPLEDEGYSQGTICYCASKEIEKLDSLAGNESLFWEYFYKMVREKGIKRSAGNKRPKLELIHGSQHNGKAAAVH